MKAFGYGGSRAAGLTEAILLTVVIACMAGCGALVIARALSARAGDTVRILDGGASARRTAADPVWMEGAPDDWAPGLRTAGGPGAATGQAEPTGAGDGGERSLHRILDAATEPPQDGGRGGAGGSGSTPSAGSEGPEVRPGLDPPGEILDRLQPLQDLLACLGDPGAGREDGADLDLAGAMDRAREGVAEAQALARALPEANEGPEAELRASALALGREAATLLERALQAAERFGEFAALIRRAREQEDGLLIVEDPEWSEADARRHLETGLASLQETGRELISFGDRLRASGEAVEHLALERLAERAQAAGNHLLEGVGDVRARLQQSDGLESVALAMRDLLAVAPPESFAHNLALGQVRASIEGMTELAEAIRTRHPGGTGAAGSIIDNLRRRSAAGIEGVLADLAGADGDLEVRRFRGILEGTILPDQPRQTVSAVVHLPGDEGMETIRVQRSFDGRSADLRIERNRSFRFRRPIDGGGVARPVEVDELWIHSVRGHRVFSIRARSTGPEGAISLGTGNSGPKLTAEIRLGQVEFSFLRGDPTVAGDEVTFTMTAGEAGFDPGSLDFEGFESLPRMKEFAVRLAAESHAVAAGVSTSVRSHFGGATLWNRRFWVERSGSLDLGVGGEMELVARGDTTGSARAGGFFDISEILGLGVGMEIGSERFELDRFGRPIPPELVDLYRADREGRLRPGPAPGTVPVAPGRGDPAD